MCTRFPFFGSERGLDAIAKIEELHADGNKTKKEIITWLYTVLNILDSKANGLLRVNGLFITLLVFFLGAARAVGNPLHITYSQVASAVLVLALVLLSTIFCFMIVRVNWKFLGQVHKNNNAYDFGSEVERLANVADDRTRYYWIGWFLTLMAIVLPVLIGLLLWILHRLEASIPAPG